MELVIKPTNSCNFRCSFCSSCDIPAAILPAAKVIDFVKSSKEPVTTIIVNGGDPLMMDPQFYWDIITFLDSIEASTTISFTTNLWGWYQDPAKWHDLFSNERIGIGTSFQYGPGRYLADGTPFDETLFLQVQNKFKAEFGTYVDFISVITDENESFAIKNVELAKQLNVQCKLNPAVCSGRQSSMYSRVKIYSIYLALFKAGLSTWEYNCLNLKNYFTGKSTTCPLGTKLCLNTIRCLGPDATLATCPNLDDNKIYDSSKYIFYKNECLLCEYFNLCNGCYKQVYDLKTKDDGSSCSDLKAIYSELAKIILNKEV